MSELIKLIQEADVAALQMERAKAAVESSKMALETAKENLESAKKSFDEVLMKADELGIPRPKVRKLIEERTSALVASGLMDDESVPSAKATVLKTAKTPKASKKSPKLVEDDKPDFKDLEDESFDENSSVMAMV